MSDGSNVGSMLGNGLSAIGRLYQWYWKLGAGILIVIAILLFLFRPIYKFKIKPDEEKAAKRKATATAECAAINTPSTLSDQSPIDNDKVRCLRNLACAYVNNKCVADKGNNFDQSGWLNYVDWIFSGVFIIIAISLLVMVRATKNDPEAAGFIGIVDTVEEGISSRSNSSIKSAGSRRRRRVRCLV